MTTVRIPCSAVTVSAATPPAPPVDCQPQAIPRSVTILARTDASNSFQSLTAQLATSAGILIAPLTVVGFVPGRPTATATAIIDVVANGPHVVIAEAVDSFGNRIRGEGPVPPVNLDSLPPSSNFSGAFPPSRACGGSTLSLSAAFSDTQLAGYAISVSAQPTTFEAKTRGTLTGTSFTGTLAPFSLDGLPGGEYHLRVSGSDLAGNSACSPPLPIHIEGSIEISGLGVSPGVVSPDGDGLLETTQLSFSASEPSNVTAELVSGTGTVMRQLASTSAPAETVLQIPSGSLIGIADGVHLVRVSATSVGCGSSTTATVPLVVDTLSPTARIDQPGAGDTVFGTVSVFGQATDSNLVTVQLEIGQGASPTTWTPAPGARATGGGLIGAVDVSTLAAGVYTLRLSVTDAGGHVARATRQVTVTPGTLLGAVSTRDRAVSPNGDGVLDSTVVEGILLATADLSVELVDQSGAVTNAASTPNASPGAFTSTLAQSLLSTLAEGSFEVRVTARQGASSETLRSQLVIDLTPPTVAIRAPNALDVRPGAQIDVEVSGATSWALDGIEGATTRSLRTGSSDFTGMASTIPAAIDGQLELVLSAIDDAGNRAEVRRGVTVDGTAPLVTIRSPLRSAFVHGRVQVLLDVTEDRLAQVSVFEVRGSSRALVTTVSSLPPDGLAGEWNSAVGADGTVSLEVEVRDRAGNAGLASAPVTIDNTPPVALLTAPTGALLRSSLSYRGTADDTNLEGWALEFGAAPPSSTATTALLSGAFRVVNGSFGTPALLPEGTYRFLLSVRDRAGNVATSQTVASLQDIFAPPPPRVLPPPSVTVTRTGARALQISWQASPTQNVVGYAINRDGQPLASVAGLTLTDGTLADGIYRYDVYAVDDSGLTSTTAASGVGNITNGPPSVALTSPAPGSRAGGVVPIVGSVTGQYGFAGYEVEVGAGASPSSWRTIASGTNPPGQATLALFDTRTLAEGAASGVRVTARSTDGAVAQASTFVLIDNTPPLAPVLTGATAALTSVTVTWQASPSPDLRGYLLLRDEMIANAPRGTSVSDFTRWILPSATTTWVDVTTDGPHQYVVLAVDEALNTARSNVLSVSVESRAPSVAIISPPSGSVVTEPTPLLVDGEDTDVASVRFEARTAGTTSWSVLGTISSPPYAYLFNPGGYPPSTIELRAIATDTSGNFDAVPSTTSVLVEEPLGPLNLSGLMNGSAMTLQWTAAAQQSVARYEVTWEGLATPRVVLPPLTSVTVTPFGPSPFSVRVEAISRGGRRRSESVSGSRYSLTVDPVPSEVHTMPFSLTGSGAPPGGVVTVRFGQSVLGTSNATSQGQFTVPLNWAPGSAPLTTLFATWSGGTSAAASVQLPAYRTLSGATVALTAAPLERRRPAFSVAVSGDTTGLFFASLMRRSNGQPWVNVGGASLPLSQSLVDLTPEFGGFEYVVQLSGSGQIVPVTSAPIAFTVDQPQLLLSLTSPPDAPQLDFTLTGENEYVDYVFLHGRDSSGGGFGAGSFSNGVASHYFPQTGELEYEAVPYVFGTREGPPCPATITPPR